MSKAFQHEDLEIKQQFFALAQEYHERAVADDSLENELAAALMYMNLADYLAEFLVQSLAEMNKEAMSKYYKGIVTVKPPKRDSFNIGTSIHFLKRYSFPQKPEILEELDEINKARIKIAHNLFKVKADKLEEIDEAENTLRTHTEKLVELIDEITQGMPPPNILDN